MPEIHLKGHLYRYDPARRRVLRVEAAGRTTLAELLSSLPLPEDEVYLVTVNGRPADGETILEEDDVVALLPPVAGG